MNTADLIRRRDAAVPRGVGSATTVYAMRAQGAELWDVEERRYVDFAAGIAVVNTGHNHPRVRAAAIEQLERFTHVCFQVAPYEPYIALAEQLNAIVPVRGPKKTIFFTTGAEAIENAVKIARYATKRSGVIAFSGGFHGRTFMAMALTGKVAPYKVGFGPLPAETYHLPFPNPLHGVTLDDSVRSLETLFRTDLDPERVAAIMIEPIQGEGGFYVAPAALLRRLRTLCDEHGILLVVDEIQTGFARTGRMFACEHSGIEPDLVTMAKGIAGGFPLSAVTGGAATMDAVGPGGLGGTFAGSPIACAAGLAVLTVIEEERLIERASVIGQSLRERLTQFAVKSRGAIGEVRGLGAMMAIELVKRGESLSVPDAERTKAVVARAAQRGVLVLPCGVWSNVIRLLPPLTTSQTLIYEGLDRLEQALIDEGVVIA
jgi:4-aminobutyrate aminotransferase / (S)-3-amino-2-methylpropionate transaminase / 5-aminovalerate transaminase